jgi:nonsense-mediated mRNA decay protein 3
VVGTFCVECGKDADTDDQLKDGLCLDCFLDRNPPIELPEVIDIVRCPTCGSVRRKGGWTNVAGVDMEDADAAMRGDVSDAIEEALAVVDGGSLRSLDLEIHPESRSAFSVEVLAEVSLMGQVVHAPASTRVRLHGEQCPVCSRVAGGAFEAVIQFRGTKDRPASSEELELAHEHVASEVDRLAAIAREVSLVKVEKIHGGLDFYLSTQAAGASIAKGLASRFNASTSSTSTTVGRKDGRDTLRITHLVRMPELRRGDLVLLRGEALRVLSASRKEVTVEPAAGEGRRRHLSRGDLDLLELLGEGGSYEDAVVVSHTGAEVQVLDPVTLRTIELPLPKGFELEGRETVKVVRREDRLYLVG